MAKNRDNEYGAIFVLLAGIITVFLLIVALIKQYL